MRVALPLVGFGVVVAMGVSACGGSGYQFVENEDLGVYAKVPDGWTIYDEADLFPDDSDRQLERRREAMWVRTFDASDEPSAEASINPGDDDPTGRVLVLRLSRQQREQINLSGLRGLGNPTQDPLAASAQDPRVRVSLDEPVEFDGGFHGVHTVFAFTEPGSDTVVTDQTVLLDAATTTMFVFQVACQEECYLETHKNIAGEDVVAVLGGTEGPLIDGRAYHEPTFLAELETYHAAVESAHQQHEKVTLPLPSTNGSTPGDVPQASLT